MEKITLAQVWGWGALGKGGGLRTLAAPGQSQEKQPLSPALCGPRTGGHGGPRERGMAHPHLLPAGSSFPCGLWGRRAPLLALAC